MHVRKTSFVFALTFMFSLLGVIVKSSSVPVVNSSTATLYVNPQTTVGTLGQNFTVNIEISDVVDLYGWEFRLRWDSTILEALNVTEGPFLKQGGDTFFCLKINNTAGYMIVDCTLLGNVPGVNGDGTLAIVEFYVETIGDCVLDLYGTILVNSVEQPIEHTAVDGYYYTSIHDVAVINLAASGSSVNVTVVNQGTHTETFNVSTYYTRLTDPLIGTQTVTLELGANITLTFTWTPPAYGRYEILAEASIVEGETDTADNIRTIIIYVGYGGSNTGSHKSESLNGYHMAMFVFVLFMPVMMLTFQKNREISLFDIPATALKQSLYDNPPNHLNTWQEWTRRQPI